MKDRIILINKRFPMIMKQSKLESCLFGRRQVLSRKMYRQVGKDGVPFCPGFSSLAKEHAGNVGGADVHVDDDGRELL
jgi:hypothetical protein